MAASPVGILPSPFLLRAPKGKYLRRMYDYVQVYDDTKGPEFGFFYPEFKLPLVSIKAADHYWTYDPTWIKLKATDNSSDRTWFRVVQVAPDKVGFFCTHNSRFLAHINLDGKTDSLNATSPFLDEGWNIYGVEPAILSREISNVKYDFSKKKETVGEPVLGGRLVVTHFGSKVALTVNRTVSHTTAKEQSWTTSSTFSESVKMSVEVPGLDKIGASAGFSLSSSKADVKETGRVTAVTNKDDTSVVLSVKPQHVTTAHFLLYKGSLQVPFTYDETVQHFDGKVDSRKGKTDGVFQANEDGVAANWAIEVSDIPKSLLEGVAEVVVDGVEAAGTVTTAGVKTGVDVATGITKTVVTGATSATKTAADAASAGAKAAGDALGSIGKGIGGIF